MSKKKTIEVVDLTLKKKRAMVIVIISVITALVLTASIIFAVWEAPSPILQSNESESTSSSAAKIANGDFYFVEEEQVSYPKSAQNWTVVTTDLDSDTRETLNAMFRTIHEDFVDVYDHNKTVAGIISTDADNWTKVSTDLSAYGINLTANPLSPESDTDNLSYLLYNKSNYASSIYSNSYSLANSSYAKVSVKLKLIDVQGNGAFIMIKKIAYASSLSAVDNTSTSNETSKQQWYTYLFEITQADYDAKVAASEADANGYVTYDFYLFNLGASAVTLYSQVGLGDVYSYNGEDDSAYGSTGCLLIDDVEYSSGTASEYVQFSANTAYTSTEKLSHIIPSTDTDTATAVNEPSNYGTSSNVNRATYADYSTIDDADGDYFESAGTLPFLDSTSITDYIYYLERTSVTQREAMYIEYDIPNVYGPSVNPTCYHLTFWMRTISPNAKAVANVYMIDGDGNEYELFLQATTSKEVETDTNNGWTQYHIYIKPGNADTVGNKIRIYFGDKVNYVSGSGNAPVGKTLVTGFTHETVTQSTYSSMSSSTTLALLDLSTSSTSTSITNNSFNTYVSNSVVGTLLPTSWTLTFAGQIDLTCTGTNEIVVPHGVSDVDTGIISDASKAPVFDDDTKNILYITNNTATVSGYLSNKVSVSAHSYVVFSVYAKGEGGAVPYIYLLNTDTNELFEAFSVVPADMFYAPFSEPVDDPAENNGYTKYYVFVVTGDTAQTFRLGLFNGALNTGADDMGTAKTTQSGTVYFDYALSVSYATYTREYLYNDDETDYLYEADGVTVRYEDEEAETMTYYIGETSEGSGVYGINIEGTNKPFAEYDNVYIIYSYKAELDAPEIVVDEDDDDEDDDTTTESTIDLALLFSILTSCLLVCSLLIVVVMKTFNIKKRIA